MKIRNTLFAASAMALLAAPLLAQTRSPEVDALDAQLPGTIINDPTSLGWATQGAGLQKKSVTGADIPGGGAATRFTVPRAGAHPYDIAANVPILTAIAKGEDVTVGFWARTISASTTDGKATLNLRFQHNADPWPGFGDSSLSIGNEWKWYEMTANSTIDIPRGPGIMAFQLSAAKQSIEIGQTIVIKGARSIQPNVTAGPAPKLEMPPQLEGKGRLINRAESRAWGFNGAASTHSAFSDKGVYMGQATRFTSPSVGTNRWDIGANVVIEEAIKTGDVLHIAVTARTVSAATEDGKGLVGIRVQDNSAAGYPGFAENAFKPGVNWQLIQIRTTATRDIPAGAAAIALHFAGAQQVVDIGPVYVLKVN